MIYHYTNKRTGEAIVFGSLAVIPEYLSITPKQLKYCFTDKKLNKYEDKHGNHIIHKLPGVVRIKRKR